MSSPNPWESPAAGGNMMAGVKRRRTPPSASMTSPSTPSTSGTGRGQTSGSGGGAPVNGVRRRLNFSPGASGNGQGTGLPAPADGLPKHYPWNLIRCLKEKLGIKPKEHVESYIFRVFQNWEREDRDNECPCGKEPLYRLYQKSNRDIRVTVGTMCQDLFEPGLALSAQQALIYLKTHPLRVKYVQEAERDRHKFLVLPGPTKHPLFDVENVIWFLKEVCQHVFIYRDGENCSIEAKLGDIRTPLKYGQDYDAQLITNIYAVAAYGAGVNLKIMIPPRC